MIQRSVVSLAVFSVCAAVCSLGTIACDKSSGGDNAAPTATASAPVMVEAAAPIASAAAPSASAAMAPAIERRHVGLAGILLKGAYDTDLTADQKAQLDKAEDQLYPAGAPSPWAAVKTFQTDLVAGIRANKVDAAALKLDEAAFDKAVAAGQASEADALSTLHAALDQPTRQKLADRIMAKRTAHEKEMPPVPADAGAGDWTKHRLDRLTKQLGLDDAQQKQVAVLLAKDTGMTPVAMQARRDAMKKRVDTLLTDFPKDGFDAKKADLSAPPGKTPHERLDQQLAFTTGILPILKPEQITKFADQTERMGSRPERYFEDIEHGPPPAGPVDEPGGR